MKTIFKHLGVDRSRVGYWETMLGVYTPFELHDGLWFKREDYFAPLGYGGPNGSKMRQLIYLMNRQRQGKTHVLTGASIQSPQLSMSAIVGAHYGLPCHQVVYSNPNTILSHPNPLLAAGFGATFHYAGAPYNPVLQRQVENMRKPDSLVVEYGITMEHSRWGVEELRNFHLVGAKQVENMPDQVTRLIVPAGSCNSLTSILLGLSLYHTNIQEVFTIGIGPDKQEWVKTRLKLMGVDVDTLPAVRHHSLHDTGYSKYTDKFVGESYGGIDFHPTYEAKMWRWLKATNAITFDGSTAFWIVGSASKAEVVRPFFTHEPNLL